MFPQRCLILVPLLCVLHIAKAENRQLTETEQHLFEQAAEVLKHSCLKCHAGGSPKSKLDLTTRAGILVGGEQGGPAFNSDNPDESSLLQAVRYETFKMPPEGPLIRNQVAVLEEWVQRGLPWPTGEKELHYKIQAGPPQVSEDTKQFWSFQPVTEPSVPETSWGHNPIDDFIVRRLSQTDVEPSPPASARTLVRRMYYSVTGLPPGPEAAAVWSDRLERADGSLDQESIADLVDSLLASPHYGEHWARHWLDLVRYAETNSYERDGAKPHVWRYRDYVIRAFNSDKPYDQFITEQLAGDELQAATAESIIATGYYRLGRWDDEPPDAALAFFDDVDDIIGTTCQTMLGLTVNCARCHDHKIDPIPQRDYYRLLAFFRNVRRYGQRTHKTVESASVREVDIPEDAGLLRQDLETHRRKISELQQLMDEFEQVVHPLLSEPQKEDFQFVESRLSIVDQFTDRGLTEAQVNHYRSLHGRLSELEKNRPSGRAKVLCITEDAATIHPTYVLIRGNPHAPGEEVTPGFPSVLSPPDAVVPEILEGGLTTGRRSVLASWIASSDNPLTARVMVNRIWQHHFGRGIVRSTSDFGFQGTPPTHPQLLDWLAVQFQKNKWSVKHMHRLIMTSATFQLSSVWREDAWNRDPLNELFWRYDMRRLTAEEIRDSILSASGQLNTSRLFGPSVYTDIPDEVKAGQSRPGSGWGKSPPEDRDRRSIYIHVKRSLVDPLLESFDFADTDQTCPVRFVTTQPTQALGLLNSDFIQQQAAQFAKLLRENAAESVTDQVRMALTRVTQRRPIQGEIEEGIRLIEALQSDDGMSSEMALQYLCLVALNLNEFIYLD